MGGRRNDDVKGRKGFVWLGIFNVKNKTWYERKSLAIGYQRDHLEGGGDAGHYGDIMVDHE